MLARLETPQLHLRFEGRSLDIAMDDLNVGLASTDAEIKQALASFLDVAKARFGFYVVDRHETGNITVRPEAVFG